MTQPSAKRETREDILRVSMSLFAKRGYDAVSMREIGAEVGVQPAALYYYFPDKRSLYLEVMKFAFTDVMSGSIAALAGDAPPLVRLKRFVTALTDDLTANPELLPLMQRERLANDQERQKLLIDEVVAKPFAVLIDTVKELAPDRDPLLTAMSVYGLVIFFLESQPISRFMPGWSEKHEKPATLVLHVTDILDSLF